MGIYVCNIFCIGDVGILIWLVFKKMINYLIIIFVLLSWIISWNVFI